MEVTGLVIGIVSLAGLFKTALEAWEFVDAGRAHAENLSFFRTRLDNQRAVFLIWAEKLGFFSPEGYDKALDSPKRRAYQVSQTLKHIALLFSSTDELVQKYGFKIHQTGTEGDAEVAPAIFHNRYMRLYSLIRREKETTSRLSIFRADIRRQQSAASTWKKFKWSVRDEKKSMDFLDKITALVDDLDKLTRDMELRNMKTTEQLATEAVQDVSENSLVEIEQSSTDRATVISSAASIRLRSIEARTIATNMSNTTDVGTFVTAQTHPSTRNQLDAIEEISQHEMMDFRSIEIANAQACAALISRVAMPPPPGSVQDGSERDNITRTRRVMKEVKNMLQDLEPNGWYTYSPVDEADCRKFLGTFRGAEGTPYEGGIFHVRLNIPDEYPFMPPKMWFLTKVLHPNIDVYGAICVDILDDQWSPRLTMEKMFVSVASLLSSPNWDNPVQSELPSDWTTDRVEFDRRAREWTKKYATGYIIHPGEREDGFSTVCRVPNDAPGASAWATALESMKGWNRRILP